MIFRWSTILLLMQWPLLSMAQVSFENQGWFTLTTQKSLSYNTKASLQLESRVDMNAGIAVNNFSNISLEQAFSNKFSAELHYRFLVRNSGRGMFTNAHRIMLDFNYKQPLKKTDLSIRLRTGREDELSGEFDFLQFDNMVIRQKIGIKRDLGKTTLGCSAEQFESITSSEIVFDQLRLVLNSEFKISKRHSVNCFLMYQNLVDVKRINFGAGYLFKFKSGKSGKKEKKS